MSRLGLFGGTGLGRWGSAARTHEIDSVYGSPSSAVAEFQFGETQVFFIPRHGKQHDIPPHGVNYRANIDAFRQLGLEGIVAVNAVGGISDENSPGTLVIPDQLIDYTWGREHSFSMSAADGLQHVEFAGPFDGHVRRALLGAASFAGIEVIDGGCLAVSQGPRLETAAEIRRFRQDGCDMVGMTSMPEAALAREAGIDYASLCVTANWAAGLDDSPISMEVIEATLTDAMTRVRKLLTVFFEESYRVR